MDENVLDPFVTYWYLLNVPAVDRVSALSIDRSSMMEMHKDLVMMIHRIDYDPYMVIHVSLADLPMIQFAAESVYDLMISLIDPVLHLDLDAQMMPYMMDKLLNLLVYHRYVVAVEQHDRLASVHVSED